MSTEPESFESESESDFETQEAQPPKRTAESELGLDLDLHFLPSWAQKPTGNQYEKFTGEEGQERGRDRRGPGGPRREGFGGGDRRGDRGPRRGDRPGGGGPRPGGPGGQGGGRPFGDRNRGGGDRGPRGRGPGQRPGAPQGPRREEIKLPELDVTFYPEEKGVESLARQIKLSGRAYPLFEIAYLVLKKPERYHVQLVSKKKADGQPAQLIYVCGLDDTIWLDENEALQHILDKHFSTFYSTEKIPTDAPKGTYTFVAQCGISGTILGPPNYHDYQNKLRKLHQERFGRMPFDAFKSRIRIVKDEAVVKKWLEEQSFRTEYTCLNIPETIKLNSREEVENHFRQTHLPNVVKTAESHTIPGTAVASLQNRALQTLLRRSFDEQMRFPLKVVNILSGQFARQGLQFFKVNKTVTHVAVARPRFLDMEATPVSEGVKRIVDFINEHPRTTRKKLLEALVPGGGGGKAPAAAQGAAPAPAAEASVPAEGAAEGSAAPAAAAPTESGGQSSEATAVVADLHWLVHQGHVIEFANGILETAKRPAPRPVKQPKTVGAGPAAEGQAAEGEVTSQEGVTAGEGSAAENAGESGGGGGEQGSGGESETATVQDESGASAGADVPQGNEMPLSNASGESEQKEQA